MKKNNIKIDIVPAEKKEREFKSGDVFILGGETYYVLINRAGKSWIALAVYPHGIHETAIYPSPEYKYVGKLTGITITKEEER